MAVRGSRVGVTNAATPLNGGDAGDYREGKRILVTNRSAVSLDIGGEDVATGAGMELAVGEAMSMELERGEVVHAVAATAGPHRVDVLLGGVA